MPNTSNQYAHLRIESPVIVYGQSGGITLFRMLTCFTKNTQTRCTLHRINPPIFKRHHQPRPSNTSLYTLEPEFPANERTSLSPPNFKAMSTPISIGWVVGAGIFTVACIALIFTAYFRKWYELPERQPRPASLPQRIKGGKRISRG